jgi:hypothetical protein
MSPAVQQQIIEEFNKGQERLKPAVLSATPENGRMLRAWMLAHDLPATAENFYKAIGAMMAALDWDVKPKKLQLIEANARPATITSAQSSEKDFLAKVHAGEARDAQAKADEASIKQAKQLIAAYHPVRNNRTDAREQQDSQAAWTASLQKAIDSKANLQKFVAALADAIQKRYVTREAAVERM